MNHTQRVLISGSSSGFGLRIAKTLIAEGFRVFATMRDMGDRNAGPAEELRTFAKDKPGSVHVLNLDVCSGSSVNSAVRKAIELEGGIDILINNAGIGDGFSAFTEAVTTEQFKRIFDVNVFGVQRLTRAVLPGFRAQGRGLLINISSTMGRIVLPFAAAYTATKFALEALSESYRYELSPLGIEVSIIEPGGFGTSFWSKLEPAAEPEVMNGYGSLSALPRQLYGGMDEQLSGDSAPSPQTVADAVLAVIRAKPGSRPLRTVVDPLMGGEGPTQINLLSARIQKNLIEGFGVPQLLAADSET